MNAAIDKKLETTKFFQNSLRNLKDPLSLFLLFKIIIHSRYDFISKKENVQIHKDCYIFREII